MCGVWGENRFKPSRGLTPAALLQVAGDLAMKEDFFTTASGRQVALRIFVQEKNLGKVGVQRHACTNACMRA